jgi:hypothetical protein
LQRRAWLTIHKAHANDPAAAYEAARRGIDELGTAYRAAHRGGRHIIDDTGQKIRLAEMAAAQGDLPRAASEAAEVLQLRVDMYVRAFDGSVE